MRCVTSLDAGELASKFDVLIFVDGGIPARDGGGQGGRGARLVIRAFGFLALLVGFLMVAVRVLHAASERTSIDHIFSSPVSSS
jgi:hypothetical protein